VRGWTDAVVAMPAQVAVAPVEHPDAVRLDVAEPGGRAFGRIGWLAFAYTLLVAFSVMYTGDHWIIDCVGGMAFAYISFYAVTHARVAQRWLARRRLRLSV